jgi:hypothetical protein
MMAKAEQENCSALGRLSRPGRTRADTLAEDRRFRPVRWEPYRPLINCRRLSPDDLVLADDVVPHKPLGGRGKATRIEMVDWDLIQKIV